MKRVDTVSAWTSSRLSCNHCERAHHTFNWSTSYNEFILHAYVDIGSMNHSREFIRGFMESMTTTMGRRINDHLRAIDPIT